MDKTLNKTSVISDVIMGKTIQLTLGRSTVEFDRTNCGVFLYWHGRLIEVGLTVTIFNCLLTDFIFRENNEFVLLIPSSKSYCQGKYLVHSRTATRDLEYRKYVLFQFLARGQLELVISGPSVWSTVNC